MRFGLAVLLCVIAVPLVAGGEQKAVTVSKAWVKAPDTVQAGAAAFATVENPGMYDIYVVSASSDAAGTVSLRAPATPGGAPAALKEAVVPAYDSLEMKPTGPHLWLTDLKRPLKAGDTISLTLVTDGGLALETKAEVRE